jgi:predicted ATP-grasp superfamily ATP-dependent carboligase
MGKNRMRVFVSEFLIGGAMTGIAASESMRREGRLMLEAVCEDIAAVPGHSVVTTLESEVAFCPNIDVIHVASSAEEFDAFQRLLTEVDAALVIAPETDGILSHRCRMVLDRGVLSWNCSPRAIDLCGDKLALADHLTSHSIPTIPTTLVHSANPSDRLPWPVVLKPRDGAGSYLTFLVKSQHDWDDAIRSFDEAQLIDRCLCQPFITGRALSIGVNIRLEGGEIECLPVAEQTLSTDGRFRYLGGKIPADISIEDESAIVNLVRAASQTIDGLAGYVGFDVLLAAGGEPLVVEINPRLTTSYVGYRQLFEDKIPQAWFPGRRILQRNESARCIQFVS